MESKLTQDDVISELYNLYADSIYRYVFLTLGNTSDALDVVQEVFLRAFRSINTYKQNASAKTWLMSIARNYMTDLFRKKRTERNFLSSYTEPPSTNNLDSVLSTLELRELLANLKPSHRQVIILRYIDDLSLKETAKVLGWSVGKVRVTTYRTMKKLHEIANRNIEGGVAYGEIRTRHS